MFDVSDSGIIRVSRGDSFNMPLILNCGTELEPIKYSLAEKDELYFGVMEANQPFETALIRKKFTYKDVNKDGDIIISFVPEDTVMVLPDMYYYQIKLRQYIPEKNIYEVHTVVPRTRFFIEE